MCRLYAPTYKGIHNMTVENPWSIDGVNEAAKPYSDMNSLDDLSAYSKHRSQQIVDKYERETTAKVIKWGIALVLYTIMVATWTVAFMRGGNW